MTINLFGLLVLFNLYVGGIWGVSLATQALALHYGRHILVICTLSNAYPILYPKEHGHILEGQRHEGVDRQLGLDCKIGKGASSQLALPEVAFEEDTLVIIYNGSDHYWCTRPCGHILVEKRDACTVPILKLIKP